MNTIHRAFSNSKKIASNMQLTKYEGVEMMFNIGLVVGWDSNCETGEI